MPIISLKDIETQAVKNRKQHETVVNQVIAKIENQNLKRGRVRPRSIDEARILSRFKQK